MAADGSEVHGTVQPGATQCWFAAVPSGQAPNTYFYVMATVTEGSRAVDVHGLVRVWC